MTQKDFVVSADGHLLEPIDLFKTRLPEHLRDLAVWEEEFEIEPFVEGGARVFRRLHTPGFEGWTVSRYRQTQRPDARGRSRAHPRGHGPRRRRRPGAAPEPVAVRPLHRPPRDVDRARPRLQRLRRSSGSRRTSTDWRRPRPIPLTDIDDAVAEIERVAAGGFRAVLLPATAADAATTGASYDPVWAAIQASGMSVFVHTQTGGVKVNDPEALTLKVVMENAQQVNQPMTEKAAAKRMVTQAVCSRSSRSSSSAS